MNDFPLMIPVRQDFPKSAPLDIPATVRRELARVPVKPGARIAVAVGSRGISNLAAVVAEVVRGLKSAGAQPFIVPAMGSHGGATPEGQRGVLEGYGVTEASMGVPIRASLEVEQVGATADGVAANWGVEALRSDGVVVINRVKPHTDFGGPFGSGILKMIAIGLGKQAGASACHRAAARLGYERVIRSVGLTLLKSVPVLCGVALVEDAHHQTARIGVLLKDEIEAREPEFLAEARRMMPRLPFDEVELLVIDRIGKDISGAGMDPNVTGRPIYGYSAALSDTPSTKPVCRRIAVLDLTPATHGNAIGIGMADFTTSRVVRAFDPVSTYMNVLTALSLPTAKIPIHFETDREVLGHALASLALPDPCKARVVRIQDTLTLGTIEVSGAYAGDLKSLATLGPARPMAFDDRGMLAPIAR